MFFQLPCPISVEEDPPKFEGLLPIVSSSLLPNLIHDLMFNSYCQTPELEQLYKVFECLWHNKPSQFYTQISYNWSPNTAKIMVELKGKLAG